MIRALIFDMDGTLVDSEKLHYDAWQQTLLQHGVESFSFDVFCKYIGVSNEQLADDYITSHGLQTDVSTMVLEKQKLYLEMIPAIELLPGVREAITRYHGRYRLAIASSSHRIELHQILSSLQFSEYFDHVVGGDMVSRKKPDPEIYLHTMSLLGCKAGECVAFEDSESGLAAAKNAGLFGIAIPNILLAGGDFSRADRVIRQIDQADDIMLKEIHLKGDA